MCHLGRWPRNLLEVLRFADSKGAHRVPASLVPHFPRAFTSQVSRPFRGSDGNALASTLASGRSVHAAGSDTIKIGLIGCGGRGAGAVASALTVNPNAKLVALADAFADRREAALKALATRFKGQVAVDKAHLFSGFDGYRNCSGVASTWPSWPRHPTFDPCTWKPASKKACMCSPRSRWRSMRRCPPGVGRWRESARQEPQLCEWLRDAVRRRRAEMIRRLRDGAIGQILAIQGTYNVGFLWHRGREPEWTEMEFQMRNWYYFTWLSGTTSSNSTCISTTSRVGS